MTGSPSLNLEKRRERALESLFPQPLQFEGDGSYAVGAAGDRLSLVDPRVEVAAELRDGEVSVDVSPGPSAEAVWSGAVLLDDELLAFLVCVVRMRYFSSFPGMLGTPF